MPEPTRRTLTIVALAIAFPWSVGASELPGEVHSGQVEIRIVFHSSPILLRQDCAFGPYTKTLVVKGTGQGQLRTQIRGEPCCPPEVTDFEVSAQEYLQMLNGLVAAHFERLDGRYSGNQQFAVVSPGTLHLMTSICSDCSDDVTVSLQMGDYQHSVQRTEGAKVPGLTEWTARWRDLLEERAKLARAREPD